MNSQCGSGVVPLPYSMCNLFLTFHGRYRTNFLNKFMGWGCSTWGTNDQIMSRGGERFTSTSSSNLKTLNLNIFPSFGGI